MFNMDSFQRLPVLPVVAIEDAAQAQRLCAIFERCGYPAVEITLRTDAAIRAIEKAAASLSNLAVLAGTVLSREEAARAVDAGAQAIISPGTDFDIVDWCLSRGVPVYPGCATPTEVQACLRRGLRAVKMFPVEVLGGVAMLKALYGPFPTMRFLPTGGVTPENLSEYLAQPNVAGCGGTWLAPRELLARGDFTAIEERALACAKLAKVGGRKG